MAFRLYFNMEKLSLEIIDSQIKLMNNDNFMKSSKEVYYDPETIDENKIDKNVKSGFVVLVMLETYLESFLNNIISTCISELNLNENLRKSIDEKIKLIYTHFNTSKKSLKNGKDWQDYKKLKEIRNEMVHFKNPFISYGTNFGNFEIGGQKIADVFMRDFLLALKYSMINITNQIAHDLNLVINDEVQIFDFDESSTGGKYVLTMEEAKYLSII